MTAQDFPKTFDFRQEETRLYQTWEQKGYFKPANDPRNPDFDPSIPPFVISMPPPNVTGELHLGHAMMVALEDMMIRQKRMEGVPTLWVPGTDHAGIATQLMVERALAEEGKTRYDLGRQAFEERVWAWKRKYGGIITTQIRRLGASCDWDREKFTLDPDLYRAVMEAFVRLWDKGLIYRGYRVINWSPGLQTAVSDLEVEYKEVEGRLYYFKYQLADGSGEFIPVATTRPETILGDTAVAVHPEDERYRRYVGREVVVPMLGRTIPVIADERVDREFGTGALKITPGHDPLDFEIGQDHGLPVRIVMDERGYMNEEAGPYAGLDRFEARRKLWDDMRAAGLVLKEEPYTHRIPVAQRGGEPIEPMASVQWFVRIQPLAERALQAVREGRIRIVPERFAKVYYHWLENIRDWTISRQLWWGHRIPAWYCMDCPAKDGRRQAEHVRFIFNPPLSLDDGQHLAMATYAELEARGLARPEILEKAAHMKVDLQVRPIVAREAPERCPVCGSPRLVQEADVLDTWFSSGLWPFSTLGWPEDTPDYRYFYPTTVMETGYDILFFWVARMIMMGLEFTDREPFRVVYLHGLVRDEKGEKMSKTKGNVIDPLEVIAQYGTDALRFTLLVGGAPGNDINLSMKKIAANRNFANKVWNMGRFVLRALDKAPTQAQAPADWTLADSWIWARLQDLIRQVNALNERYLFGEAGKLIYEFAWKEFADWYLEMAKPQLAAGGDRAYYTAQALVKVLDAILRLLHPYTPFVTEALWGHLKAAVQARFGDNPDFTPEGGWPDMLIVAPWPRSRPPEGWEDAKVALFQRLQALVRAIRNYRAEQGIEPKTKLAALLVAGDDVPALASVHAGLALVARLDPNRLRIVAQGDAPPQATAIVAGPWVAYLEVPRDPALLARMQKRLAKVEAEIQRLEALLAGPFAEKAPPSVVARARDQLARYREEAVTLRRQLA